MANCKAKKLVESEVLGRNPGIDVEIIKDFRSLRDAVPERGKRDGYRLTSPFAKPQVSQPRVTRLAVRGK